MARSRVAVSRKRNRHPPSESLAPPAATPPAKDSSPQVVDELPSGSSARKDAGIRLWGFVRRNEDAHEPTVRSELMPQDIAIWHDKKRGRFEIVADHKVIDDLAPLEFVQFVRALRFSTTQILYKFENRTDGVAGRPVCVWYAPLRPGVA